MEDPLFIAGEDVVELQHASVEEIQQVFCLLHIGHGSMEVLVLLAFISLLWLLVLSRSGFTLEAGW